MGRHNHIFDSFVKKIKKQGNIYIYTKHSNWSSYFVKWKYIEEVDKKGIEREEATIYK